VDVKELKITIPGSVVSKKNSKQVTMIGGKNCPRRPMILPSKAYKAWESQARQSAWGRAIIPPLTCDVHVEAHFFYRGNQPDLSGAMESIADCLEGVFYADDKQIMSWDGSRLHHDKYCPRTEVTVRWEETQREMFGGRE